MNVYDMKILAKEHVPKEIRKENQRLSSIAGKIPTLDKSMSLQLKCQKLSCTYFLSDPYCACAIRISSK